ncbi:MAG: pyridoxal phosphate-dependent aminotransferase [Fusobacteriaceae bacterium]|jgi:aminotransferase/cystathionine beta-lyase|nr:pyridoxal phosphate-dependent aminotransferase [Fusobacteriaceae bacterium]
MSYDFKTRVSRKNKGSSKWELMYEWNPNVSEGVVPLSVADMEFKTIPEVVNGLKKYLDETVLGYTKATDVFLDTVVSWCDRRYGYKIEKEWIVNTPGVVTAFFGAVNTFSEPGDGIVIFRPVYYPFSMAIERNNRKVINCPLIETNGYYTIDYDKFDQLTKDLKVKILLFSSPHNPVGRVWTREELEKLAKIAIKNDIIIVSDEIHCDLILPGYKHTVFATVSKEIEDRLIICFAPSKTFNLAGLGLSNIIIKNKKLRDKYIDKMTTLRGLSINTFGFKACEIVYNEGEKWLSELLEVIDTNQKIAKEYFEKNFPKIKSPLIEGTYLQWLDFRALGLSNAELEKFLHIDAEFFTDEGYVFGSEGSGYERINLAAPTEVVVESLERLGKALKNIYK